MTWILTCGAWEQVNVYGAIGTVRYNNSKESGACIIANYDNIVSNLSVDVSTGIFTVTLKGTTSYVALKILNI